MGHLTATDPTNPADASTQPPLLLAPDQTVTLTQALAAIDGTRAVALDPAAADALDRAAAAFRATADSRTIYGYNTGFGPMIGHRIAAADATALQYNLVRSHALGLGRPLSRRQARATLFARAVSLSRNRSAVRAAVPATLLAMLRADLVPWLPSHGGVGASGDLVQLAHMALCAIGEGELLGADPAQPIAARSRFDDAGLAPLTLQGRDGLALINGTSAMTGVALTVLDRSCRLFGWALAAGAVLQEVTGSLPDPFSAALNAARRHPPQQHVAAQLRALLHGSQALRAGPDDPAGPGTGAADGRAPAHRPFQEHYSIRCLPQILGPILATLTACMASVIDELNSATDNPVFLPESGQILHGGNFHGEAVAVAMDQLKAGIVKLTLLSERQLNFVLNDAVNGVLPPFVNLGPVGLTLGLQAAQFTATSTTAESQSLAYPMAVHSLPSNKDNQDVVSMGLNAAVMADQTVDNLADVLTILWLALAQAVDALAATGGDLVARMAPATRALYAEVRGVVPRFDRDTLTAADLRRLRGHLLARDAIPSAQIQALWAAKD